METIANTSQLPVEQIKSRSLFLSDPHSFSASQICCGPSKISGADGLIPFRIPHNEIRADLDSGHAIEVAKVQKLSRRLFGERGKQKAIVCVRDSAGWLTEDAIRELRNTVQTQEGAVFRLYKSFKFDSLIEDFLEFGFTIGLVEEDPFNGHPDFQTSRGYFLWG